MKASDTIRNQKLEEILKGKKLRSDYAKETNTPFEDVVREDIKPTVSYVKQKGYVSTDEPSVGIVGSTKGSVDLMDKPIYEELLKELRAKKIKDQIGQ